MNYLNKVLAKKLPQIKLLPQDLEVREKVYISREMKKGFNPGNFKDKGGYLQRIGRQQAAAAKRLSSLIDRKKMNFKHKVEAKYAIVEKIKDLTKRTLKKGIISLVGLSLFAGAASAKDLTKAKQVAKNYETTIEQVAKDEGLKVDATVKLYKKGLTKGVIITLKNKEDGDLAKITFFQLQDGSFQRAKLGFNKGKDKELDYVFEELAELIYTYYQDNLGRP